MIRLGFHSFVQGKRAPHLQNNQRSSTGMRPGCRQIAPIPAGALTQLQRSCFPPHSPIPCSSSSSSIPATRLIPSELLFTGAGGGPHLLKVEVMVPICTGASTAK